MAARFPIVSLTPGIFEKICICLEPADLFELAQGSEESHDLVKNCMKLVEKTLTLDVSLLENSSDVRMFYTADKGTIFDWALHNKRSKERFELEDLEPRRTVNEDSESEKPIVFYQTNREAYASVYTGTEDILKIAQYLADLFDLPVGILFIERHHLDHINSILSYDMIKKGQLEFVEIGQGVVSHSELIQILEEFGSQLLAIANINTHSGFVYDKIISQQCLRVRKAEWFTGPMLMNLDCERVTLTDCELENEDVNKFLRQQVMNSSSHELKTMGIYKYRVLPDVEFDEDDDDFEGLQLDDGWDEKKFVMAKITEGLDEFYEEHAGFDPATKRRFKTTNGTFLTVEIENEGRRSSIELWTGLFDNYSDALFKK